MTDVLEPNIKIILYYTALDRRKGEFYATLLGPRSFNVMAKYGTRKQNSE